jgi:hypothetical protein
MPDNGYLSESAMLAGAAEYQEDEVLNSPDRFSLNPETAAAEAKVAPALKARAERTGKPLPAAAPAAPVDWRSVTKEQFDAGLTGADMPRILSPADRKALEDTAAQNGTRPPTPDYGPEIFVEEAMARGLPVDHIERWEVRDGTVPLKHYNHAKQQKELFLRDPSLMAKFNAGDRDAKAEWESIRYLLSHRPR